LTVLPPVKVTLGDYARHLVHRDPVGPVVLKHDQHRFVKLGPLRDDRISVDELSYALVAYTDGRRDLTNRESAVIVPCRIVKSRSLSACVATALARADFIPASRSARS